MTGALVLTDLQKQVLELARRREVFASEASRTLGVPVEQLRTAIRGLRRKHQLYVSSKAKGRYYGSTEAGYRAI